MDRNYQLTDADRRQLDRVASVLDCEAQTWREGFAVYQGREGEYLWSGSEDTEFAHVRCVKLENAAAFLRRLARPELLGMSPRMEAAIAAF